MPTKFSIDDLLQRLPQLEDDLLQKLPQIELESVMGGEGNYGGGSHVYDPDTDHTCGTATGPCGPIDTCDTGNL